MIKEKRKRPVPLSDWVPKIMKYFPTNLTDPHRPATSHTQKKKEKKKKEKDSEITNREGIVESK